MGTFAEALISMLEPMIYDGAEDLPIYLSALSDPTFQLVNDYAGDQPFEDGTGRIAPGYSVLVDANRVPDEAIRWLAQFVGVKIPQGLSFADQREILVAESSWKRGTPAALKAAPLPYLTGSKTVIVKERDTSAYHLEVITYDSETPDSDAVLAALLTQKPAGLVMTYTVFSGQKAFLMRDSIMRGSPHDSLRLVI